MCKEACFGSCLVRRRHVAGTCIGTRLRAIGGVGGVKCVCRDRGCSGGGEIAQVPDDNNVDAQLLLGTVEGSRPPLGERSPLVFHDVSDGETADPSQRCDADTRCRYPEYLR